MLTALNKKQAGWRVWMFFDHHLVQAILLCAFTVAVGMMTTLVITDPGSDLEKAFLPSLHHWRKPWQDANLMFPWSVIILMPLRLVPPVIAKALINMLSVVLIALVIKRYGGNLLLVIPIIVSPIGYWLLTTAQMDALILAGFLFLPAGYDLLFLWKPQVVLHALWVRCLHNPKTYILAGSIILTLSFVIWGNWVQVLFVSANQGLAGAWWNRSMWPYGIPLGVLLVYVSVKRSDETYGVMASPLLSPYVNGPSYVGLAAMLAAKFPRLFWTVYIGFWIYVIIKT